MVEKTKTSQQQLQDELAQDRAFLEEFSTTGPLSPEEETEVIRFREEIEAKEVALAAIERMTAIARGEVEVVASPESMQSTHRITREQVGWLGAEEVELAATEHTSPSGKPFRFTNITEQSRATALSKKKFRPDVVAAIEEKVRQHIGAKLDQPDQQFVDLRPLENSSTTEHTSLHAYKDDNVTAKGFKNNDLRVLVLEDTSTPEPTYMLASVSLHDEQQTRIYGL